MNVTTNNLMLALFAVAAAIVLEYVLIWAVTGGG